ncbi:hypothetical protein [Arcticibacter svalbardensis]|uniref:hypothetical protein n=1 Tax=Arcticibacter svalbardensis TaxID=1288027 RepID=UPI00190F3B70|nr:hypothetical protein [Arcticibacter svalbardensis]
MFLQDLIIKLNIIEHAFSVTQKGNGPAKLSLNTSTPKIPSVKNIEIFDVKQIRLAFTSENYLTKVYPDEPTFFDTSNYIAMATNETIIKAGA